MVPDIRVSISFKDHRKRRKLERLIGPAGVLALLDLWLSTAETHPNGRLVGMDEVDIELDANWGGAPGAFLAACLDVGWIDRVDDCYVLHDWAEHQAYVVDSELRSRQARHAARTRWAAQATQRANSNAGSMQGAMQDNAPNNAGSMQGAMQDNAPNNAGSMQGAMQGNENSNAPCPTIPYQRTPPLKPPQGGCRKVGRSQFSRDTVRQATDIYLAYPRHVGRQPAILAICKAIESGRIDGDRLLVAVRDYATAVDGHPDISKIPHCATWVNQQRWEDDPKEWSAWRRTGNRVNTPDVVTSDQRNVEGLGL